MAEIALPRILVADDEEPMARLIRRRLAEHGLDMVWARDGDDALSLIRAESFAVVVLDYRMPRRDGLEVLRAIREAGCMVPAVLMSGMGSLDVAVEAIRLGAADYVVKDGNATYLDLLPSVVTRLIERQRLIADKDEAQHRAIEQSRLLKATLDTINQGLCVFDADLGLVAWNQRFLDLYRYPDEMGVVGAPLAAFLRHNAECGDYGPGPVDELVAPRLERARAPQDHCHEHVRGDGTVIEVRGAAMPDGGFVSTHTDISDSKALEQQLRDALAEQTMLLENSLVGICLVAERRFIQVNPKMIDMFGYDRSEIIGRSTLLLHPDQQAYDTLTTLIQASLPHGGMIQTERLMRRKDGSLIWCLMQGRAIAPNTPLAGTIWNIQDISERKRAEEQMRLTQSVFNAAGEGIMVLDRDRRIEIVNPAFTEITGYGANDVIGRAPNMLLSGHHDATFYDEVWQRLEEHGRWEGDIWNRRKDGSLYAERISIRSLQDEHGQTVRYVAIFHDITHRKEDEERAWHRANYDALTDLPNRALFLDRLQQAQAQAERDGGRFGLLFIDLDGFKAVNDSLGHACGDDLLQQVATRLLACVRSIDTVGRLGGDEFVVIIGGMTQPQATTTVAGKILDELARPFAIDHHVARVSGSIGIALYPDDSRVLPQLMEMADQAMYGAKRRGRNRFCLVGGM